MIKLSLSDAKQECVFCQKFVVKSRNQDWYDQVLFEDDSFLIVPAVGPFREGHIMILPKHHHLSIASMSDAELERVSKIKCATRKILATQYGPPIAFEHGITAQSEVRSGTCIDHAHLHLLVPPNGLDMLNRISAYHSFFALQNLQDLRAFNDSGTNYLFVEEIDESMHAACVSELPTQYMRRIIAEHVGYPDKWDYAIFPNREAILATIQKLHPLLENLCER